MRRTPFAAVGFARLPLRLTVILTVAVLLGPSLLVAAQEERAATFHGNVARTGEQPGPNPKGKGQQKWRFQTEGAIRSSPVISGGVIYFGSNDGRLYAIEAENGEPRWSYETGGAVRTTPTVEGGLVVFGSDDGYVYCLSTDKGELQWRFLIGRMELTAGTTAPDFLPRRTVTSSPLVVDGVVYIGSNDQTLHAIDLATGIERWNQGFRGPTVSSPSFRDNVVYVGTEDGVWAMDARTGHIKWSAIWGLPTEDKDQDKDDDDDGTPNDQDEDDDNDGVPDDQDQQNDAEGNGQEGDTGDDQDESDQEDSQETSLEEALADGKMTVSELFNVLGGFTWNVTAAPVPVGNLIHAVGFAESVKKQPNGKPATVGGVLLQLDATTGAVTGLWIFGTYDLVTTTPAVVDDTIYLGSDRGMVYAVEATLSSPTVLEQDESTDSSEGTTFASNQQRWGVQTEKYVLASPAVVGETVYVGNAGGVLYSLDTKTGKERWSFQTGGPIWSSPAVSGSVVYVGSDDGFLYAIGGS